MSLPAEKSVDLELNENRVPHRLLIVAFIAVGSIPLIAPFDAQIASKFASWFHDGNPWRRLFKLPSNVFEGRMLVVLFLVLLLYGQRKQLAKGYLSVVAGCLGVLYLTKFVFGRARPNLEEGAYSFHFFGNIVRGQDSFPSGHTTNVFLVVALMFVYFKRPGWVFLPLAILVAMGRIIQERHFPSDVLGGIALAFISVWVAYRVFGVTVFPDLSQLRFTDQVRRLLGMRGGAVGKSLSDEAHDSDASDNKLESTSAHGSTMTRTSEPVE